MISDGHRDLYRRYYRDREVLSRPSVWIPRIEALADELGARTVLDYGCGAAQGVSTFSKLTVRDYDPGVPSLSRRPQPADLVVSIHALEHVEPLFVDAVLRDMERLAELAVFVVVSCETSTKVLPDGSPWHSFVKSAEWWRNRLRTWEERPTIKTPDREFAALLRPR